MGLKRKCESADEEREEADEEGGREANQIGDGSAYSPLLGIFSGLQHLFPPPTTPAPSQRHVLRARSFGGQQHRGAQAAACRQRP